MKPLSTLKPARPCARVRHRGPKGKETVSFQGAHRRHPPSPAIGRSWPETMVALVLGVPRPLRKFGGDSLEEVVRNRDGLPRIPQVDGCAQHSCSFGMMGAGKTDGRQGFGRTPGVGGFVDNSDAPGSRRAAGRSVAEIWGRRRGAGPFGPSRPNALSDALSAANPVVIAAAGRQPSSSRTTGCCSTPHHHPVVWLRRPDPGNPCRAPRRRYRTTPPDRRPSRPGRPGSRGRARVLEELAAERRSLVRRGRPDVVGRRRRPEARPEVVDAVEGRAHRPPGARGNSGVGGGRRTQPSAAPA